MPQRKHFSCLNHHPMHQLKNLRVRKCLLDRFIAFEPSVTACNSIRAIQREQFPFDIRCQILNDNQSIYSRDLSLKPALQCVPLTVALYADISRSGFLHRRDDGIDRAVRKPDMCFHIDPFFLCKVLKYMSFKRTCVADSVFAGKNVESFFLFCSSPCYEAFRDQRRHFFQCQQPDTGTDQVAVLHFTDQFRIGTQHRCNISNLRAGSVIDTAYRISAAPVDILDHCPVYVSKDNMVSGLFQDPGDTASAELSCTDKDCPFHGIFVFSRYSSASTFHSPLCAAQSSCSLAKKGSSFPSFSKSAIAVRGISISV